MHARKIGTALNLSCSSFFVQFVLHLLLFIYTTKLYRVIYASVFEFVVSSDKTTDFFLYLLPVYFPLRFFLSFEFEIIRTVRECSPNNRPQSPRLHSQICEIPQHPY